MNRHQYRAAMHTMRHEGLSAAYRVTAPAHRAELDRVLKLMQTRDPLTIRAAWMSHNVPALQLIKSNRNI